MSMKYKKTKIILILLLPLGFFLSYVLSFAPNLIEQYYSNGIYRVISQPLSIITGIFPFSLGELLVILFILYLLITLIKFFRNFKFNEIKKTLFNSLIKITITLGIIYFTFISIWGLNYQRLTFSEISNLNVKPAKVDELISLNEVLIKKANKLRKKVKENELGIMYLPRGKSYCLKNAYKGYRLSSKLYPELKGKYGNPKPVYMSNILSYLGISGIYFPFTSEANVNMFIPDSMFPVTTFHEMAHQRGFAKEDEANYIAYVTCNIHPNVSYKYSGTLLGVIYSMNALYKYDREEFLKLKTKYSDGVKRDLIAINDFWNKYEGFLEETSSKINNAYLKSNMQEDGIHSYGKMVDLLIAEYRKKGLLVKN
ncbi:MAG: DUF3810 domain-containing protein [Firmicutes bacterium]|nr:DUF3810 domain-containing protein [Bacillota bacterium]